MINDTTPHESFDAERTHSLLGEGVLMRQRVRMAAAPRLLESIANEIPEDIRRENLPTQPAAPSIAQMAVQQAMPESDLSSISQQPAEAVAAPMTYPQPQSIYPVPTAESTMPAYDREASVRDALQAVQESMPSGVDAAQPGVTPIHDFLMEHPREGGTDAMPQTISSMPQDELASIGYSQENQRQTDFGLAGN